MQMQTPYDYESAWRNHTPPTDPHREASRRESSRQKHERDPEHRKNTLIRGILVVVGIFLLLRGAYGYLGPDAFRLFSQLTVGGTSSHADEEPVEVDTSFIDELPKLLMQDNLSRHPFSEQRLLEIMCNPSQSFDCEEVKAMLAEMDVDWNENALKSAELTLERQPLSQARLYALLVDPAAHGFTEEQAQYAVEHVQADWFENALRAAKQLQEKEELSDEELFRRLTDPDSYAFSEEEAQWAVEQWKNPEPERLDG